MGAWARDGTDPTPLRVPSRAVRYSTPRCCGSGCPLDLRQPGRHTLRGRTWSRSGRGEWTRRASRRSRVNAARNSSCVTGWGPVSGPASLKQSRCTCPPRPVTDARLATYARRSSPSNVWSSPQSSTVSNTRSETVEVEGIGHHEVGVDAARRGLLARDRQRGLRHIDAEDLEAQRGDVKGVLARPAPGIEHRAGERAFVRQTPDRRLRAPGVPRGRAVEVRRIPGLARPALVTGRWAPAGRCRLGFLPAGTRA